MQSVANLMIANLSKYKKLQDDKFESITSKFELKKIDIEIMIYLDHCGDKDTARDIAEIQRFTKGHISQSTKRLTERGYLSTVKDQNDLRITHLALTNSAKNVLKELYAVRNKAFEIAFKGVTEEELKVVKKVCLIVCENIDKDFI